MLISLNLFKRINIAIARAIVTWLIIEPILLESARKQCLNHTILANENKFQVIEVDRRAKSKVGKLFNINLHAVYRWLKRKNETGDVKAKPNKPIGNGHKILDWEKFKQFAKMHGDKTQAEMAALWKGEISTRTISRPLQKIGFTRKKKHMVTANAMKKSANNFWMI